MCRPTTKNPRGESARTGLAEERREGEGRQRGGIRRRKPHPFKSKRDYSVARKGEEGEKKEELKKKRKKETGREEGERAIKKER